MTPPQPPGRARVGRKGTEHPGYWGPHTGKLNTSHKAGGRNAHLPQVSAPDNENNHTSHVHTPLCTTLVNLGRRYKLTSSYT